MITEETVLIIGAGGSVPYGYPTGAGLRRDICTNFPDYYVGLYTSTPKVRHELETEKYREAETFCKIFKNSSIESIDRFLSINHEKYGEIGKKAIVLSLLKAELESKFREDVESKTYNQDWYSLLYNKMISTFTDPESYQRFSENKVSVITFNYDRSLEYFLYDSLCNSYSHIQQEKIAEQLDKIKFVHVYGCLANPPWSKGLKYQRPECKEVLNQEIINNLYPNIRTIHQRTNDDELKDLLEIIKESKNIYFLGFGFADENLQILDLENTINENQRIYATSLGLEANQEEEIQQKLIGHLPKKEMSFEESIEEASPFFESSPCSKLLKMYPLT